MMRSVLLVSAGVFHPPLLARMRLRCILAELPGYRLQSTRSLVALSQVSRDEFAGIVLYYHRQRVAPANVTALTNFVQQGGGLLAIHSATASFKQSDDYFALLGGRFAGHGPVEAITVQPSATAVPIFGEIRPFTILDELYRHEHKTELQVHFYAVRQEEQVPLVWTRLVGNGRVCYVGPGHRSATMRHPAMRQILQKGLQWACCD